MRFRSICLTLLGALMAALVSCGGGGGGNTNNNSTPPTPPVTRYTVTFTVANNSGGTVSPASVTVDDGGTATTTAMPNSGQAASVSGMNATIANNVISVPNVRQNGTVTVTFTALKPYTLAITLPETVRLAENGTTYKGTCSFPAATGDTFVFDCAVHPGWVFDSASGTAYSYDANTKKLTVGPLPAGNATLAVANPKFDTTATGPVLHYAKLNHGALFEDEVGNVPITLTVFAAVPDGMKLQYFIIKGGQLVTLDPKPLPRFGWYEFDLPLSPGDLPDTMSSGVEFGGMVGAFLGGIYAIDGAGTKYYAFAGATMRSIQVIPALGVIKRSEQVAATQVDTSVFATDHVVNLVHDIPELLFDVDPHYDLTITNAFYKHWPDSFDHLTFVDTNTAWGGCGVSLTGNVRNDVRGIGMDVFDNTALYGSKGLLRAIVFLVMNDSYTSYVHEFGHMFLFHWNNEALDLTETVGVSKGVHLSPWNDLYDPMRFMGNGIGLRKLDTGDYEMYQRPTLYVTDPPLYFTDYSMYGLGLIDAKEIVPAHFVLDSAYKQWSVPYTVPAAKVVTVSGTDLVSVYGPRVPDVATSPKRFQDAFILVSQAPAEPAELAYAHFLAKWHERDASEMRYPQPFSTLTRGKGSIVTTLPAHK